MLRYRFPAYVGLLLGLAPALSAQSTNPARLTMGIRGGLAFPRVALGADSTYQGDVQVSWQAELGVRIAPGFALGFEAIYNRTPEFAGDCPSKCSPSPDYTAFSGVLNWAPGGGDSRPAILVSAGVGLYRVHGDYGPAKSTEFGVHAAMELPVVSLSRTFWLSPGLRGDLLPGVPSSGMYVLSLTVGFRYWGL